MKDDANRKIEFFWRWDFDYGYISDYEPVAMNGLFQLKQ